MTTTTEYVLGTGHDESARLGLQHRLWSWVTHRLWERAGVRPGMSVLDAGCGPGHTAMELAQIVGPQGRVVGLDESAAFLKELGEEAKARHFTHVARVLGDVQNLEHALPGREGTFDLAYLRWVLCFVSRPQDVIGGLAKVIKPGGRVVIQDYFNYEYSIKIAPREAVFERAIDAVATSWRSRGGDPDIVARLPGMLREAGFEVRWLDSVQRVARSPAAFETERNQNGVCVGASGGVGGGDPMWHWPDTFFRTFLPKLVEPGFLTKQECEAAIGAWDRAAENPSAFVLLPTVFELIAVRL
ncbi:MAG: methyltransferase domain-containing protein [Tepidisphaera sp.]